MRDCMQFRTQNVLEHGDAVWAAYQLLLDFAMQEQFPDGWRQPKWWSADVGRRLAGLQPGEVLMANYLRYHDCGKPQCRVVDDEGRAHFPEHARHSAALWQSLGGHPDEVWLMANDMLLHTGSAEDCEPLKGHRLAPALLFAALAELHANAPMFGGVETVSFKAKAKHLERRSAQLLRA